MVSSQHRTARFSAYLFLTLVAFAAFVAGFVLYVRSEKLIDRAHEARLQSVQLAQELRQSSNDLTRMVRTYVVTGDPAYKANYQAILDIRDGRTPMPVDYDNAYWDLLPAGGAPRPAAGTGAALLDRMRSAGFTDQEFAKLADAKGRSDALTRIELAAMALIESAAPPAAAQRAQAIRMLHDAAYHQAKAGIMQPISDADRMMDQRTLQAVHAAEDRALTMRLVLILLGLAPVALLWLIRRELYAILGGSVPELQRSIVRLGGGDFATAVDVPAGREDSVLGWIAETRGRLARLELHHFKALVESTDDAIIGRTLSGVITSWNPAAEKVFGFVAGDAVGKPLHALIPPERGDEMLAVLARVTRGERIDRFETVRLHSDGRRIDIAATVSPIEDEAGNVVGVSEVARDITDRKRGERELAEYRERLESLVAERTAALSVAKEAAEAASRAKSIFLANMSHELRTPMNAIIGMTELTRRGTTNEKEVENLTKVIRASHHLLGVINDILDISKIEAERVCLEEIDFELGSVLANVELLTAGKAREKDLRLVVDVDPVLRARRLCGDPSRLGQILVNLASNAIKFTAAGTITIQAAMTAETSSSGLLRFDVVDTGIGIATEDQGRLFTAFEQADDSTTRRFGGTGLGLAICKRLVHLMGGEIGLASTTGSGSRFWFTVRVGKSAAVAGGDHPSSPVAAAAAAEAQIRVRHAGAPVLLVEDDPINQEVSRMLLEDVALRVDLADDGEMAVAMAGREAYALVLMDMQMPRLDGVGATQAIRALPGYAATPILAMTANAFADDRARCIAAGMNDFIAKPVAPEHLFATLLTWLDRHRH